MSKALTQQERAVVSALSILSLGWQFDDERAVLVAIIRDGVKDLRPTASLSNLRIAAGQVLDARTSLEWTYAKAAVARALIPVLRADVVPVEAGVR
jgi:hypothetical protein